MRVFFQKLIIGMIVMFVVLAAMIMLPHDAYTQWQAVKVEAYARLGWIYERIHYDDTPIDIAFIGTSHTMMGVNPLDIEKDLNDAGVRTTDDQCLHTVNLAIPAYGRDLHWIIGRELLQNRKVKLLVVEVFENETRKAHPLFVHVADTEDVFGAPMLINLNYLHNLIRLPYRQLSLAVKSLSPKTFGLKDSFTPDDYDGSNIDNTQVINVGGAALSPLRDKVMSPDQLEETARKNAKAKNLHILGDWGSLYEYAVPDYYLRSLLDLAREKGTDIVFLYLPQYGTPSHPADEHFYKNRGDWIFMNDLLHNPAYWFDEAHLNAEGATAVTQRITSEFLTRWKSSPDKEDKDGVRISNTFATCTGHSYPPRTSLKPFVARKNESDDEEGP